MKRLIACCTCLFLLLCSCSDFTITKPDGFAEINNAEYYKAISPEGMIFKVKTEKNYPRMELDFWSRALKTQLSKQGYKLVRDETDYTAHSKDGIILEWGLPYGNKDYIYLTALLVQENKIFIGQAAGEYTIYNKYRDSIIKSLQSLIIK